MNRGKQRNEASTGETRLLQMDIVYIVYSISLSRISEKNARIKVENPLSRRFRESQRSKRARAVVYCTHTNTCLLYQPMPKPYIQQGNGDDGLWTRM